MSIIAQRLGISGFGLAAKWTALPLRLIIGFGFMEHGFAKLGRGVDGFAHILQAIGMPFSSLLAWSTVLIEIGGGLAILLGAPVLAGLTE